MNFAKKVIILILTCFLFSCIQSKKSVKMEKVINRNCESKFTYRCTNWGMSQESVIKSEMPVQPYKKNSLQLFYFSAVFDYDSYLTYVFDEDNTLKFTSQFIDIGLASSDKEYNKIKKLLTKKFGKSKYIKNNESYTWKTRKKNVFLSRTSNKRRINIIYTKMSFKQWIDFLMLTYKRLNQ